MKVNPYLVKHTKAIEAIQRRASRLICGPDKEYPERVKMGLFRTEMEIS